MAYARVVETVPDFSLPKDPLEWHATCHHNDPKLMEYAEFFADFKKSQYLKLMYVWGHSYEFDNNDNWDVIETTSGTPPTSRSLIIWMQQNVYSSLRITKRYITPMPAAYGCS